MSFNSDSDNWNNLFLGDTKNRVKKSVKLIQQTQPSLQPRPKRLFPFDFGLVTDVTHSNSIMNAKAGIHKADGAFDTKSKEAAKCLDSKLLKGMTWQWNLSA